MTVGGWYIKLSGTTGSKGVDSTTKLSMVPSFVRSLMNREYFQFKETAMVQRTWGHRKEIKYFVITNPHRGEETDPLVAANHKNTGGRSFREHPYVEEFVLKVKRKYEKKFSMWSTVPVFRCDLVLLQDGRLYVNEIEHFEAQITGGLEAQDIIWKRMIPEFWEDHILYMIAE